jgi:hypothetical protein
MDFFDVPEGVTLFETAEEAALADWAATPAAQARVVEVRPSDNATALWVVLQLGAPTGFHDQDIVTCVRRRDGRWWTSASTGASSGWYRRRDSQQVALRGTCATSRAFDQAAAVSEAVNAGMPRRSLTATPALPTSGSDGTVDWAAGDPTVDLARQG